MQNQLHEQLLAQVAAGVGRFDPSVLKFGSRMQNSGHHLPSEENQTPVAATGTPPQAAPSLLKFQAASPFQVYEKMRSCQSCSLAQSRLGVCVSESFARADIFVLAEAPTPLAESAVFDSKSALFEGSGFADCVLGRLLARLPKNLKTHRSYSLKCVPRKGPSLNERRICAEINLVAELQVVQPQKIFVFGALAHQAFLQALAHPDLATFMSGTQVLVFPSAEQLEAHVGWRAGVWTEIQASLLTIPSPVV